MLNLDNDKCAWPQALRPMGHDSSAKEAFSPWWIRHNTTLSHLEVRIAEQWIYRHWSNSPYAFLPLDRLHWRLESWPTKQILESLFTRSDLNAEWDYQVYNRSNSMGGHPTSLAMNATGTWDYPIVVLETPDGISGWGHAWPDERYLLIEGHSRLRYLNALYRRGDGNSSHELFLLNSI